MFSSSRSVPGASALQPSEPAIRATASPASPPTDWPSCSSSSLSQRIHYHANRIIISRACDFFDLSWFLPNQPAILQAPQQNRHPERSARRSITNRGLYGAESKDPGDACWQMLLGAFRPQTTPEDKRSQTPTVANPDFLPRSARQGHVCAFLLRKGA